MTAIVILIVGSITAYLLWSMSVWYRAATAHPNTRKMFAYFDRLTAERGKFDVPAFGAYLKSKHGQEWSDTSYTFMTYDDFTEQYRQFQAQ